MRNAKEEIDELTGQTFNLIFDNAPIEIRFTEPTASSYMNNMDDEMLAKWVTLLHGIDLINDICGYDDECVKIKMNALRAYINDRTKDVKHKYIT